ncbi:MAG: Hsp20/alpha crystallin family protein [Planctomycetaceae bacterium]
MLMTRLSTYAPGSFVSTVRRELDEAFNQAFGTVAGAQTPCQLPLTIWEDEGNVYLQADVPGYDRESIDLEFQDGKLWMRAERKVPRDDGKYWHNERMFGRSERAISIPETIDPESIDAELTDGVLCITLKKRPEARPTKIAIKADGGGHKKRLTGSGN